MPLASPERSGNSPTVSRRGCCGRRNVGATQRSVTIGLRQRDLERSIGCISQHGGPFSANAISTTEYRWWDFLPRAVGLQFRKLANIYFSYILIIMALGTATACWQTDGPWGIGITLLAVMAYSIIVLGVTDCQRGRSDREINSKETRVLRSATPPTGSVAEFVDSTWGDVLVGDIILLKKGEVAPCDLLPLCCSDPFGLFFVTTTELDGETNRKVGSVAPALVAAFADPNLVPSWSSDAAPATENAQAEPPVAKATSRDPMHFKEIFINTPHTIGVEAEPPGPSITTFNGRVSIEARCDSMSQGTAAALAPKFQCSLHIENLMLRSTSLQSTEWLVGVALYTGMESRVMLNLVDEPSKLFSIDKALNNIMKIAAVVNVAVVLVSVVGFVLSPQDDFSVGDACIEGFPAWLGKLFTYQTYYQNVIPIAVYLLMETVNILQSCLLTHDPGLRHPDTARRPQVKNLRVCQEIGMVDFVFSDKTGTLTKNEMVLQKLLVFPLETIGTKGCLVPTPLLLDSSSTTCFNVEEQLDEVAPSVQPSLAKGLEEALVIMSVANTVYPTSGDGFECESPDEEALVRGAKAAGVELIHRGMNTAECMFSPPGGCRSPVATQGKKTFKVVGVHAFNSTRKRMSVVVANEDGTATVYCKGADNVMLERVIDSEDRRTLLNQYATNFAEAGLRTLVLARRDLSAAELKAWRAAQVQAAATPTGASKDEANKKVAAMVESSLHIVAVTAIEDKLQDNVPDTLRSLRAMGIRLWVLTGDKLETAISIGFSSRTLFSSDLVLSFDASGAETSSSDLRKGVRTALQRLQSAIHGDDLSDIEEDSHSDEGEDSHDVENPKASKPHSDHHRESHTAAIELCATCKSLEEEFEFVNVCNWPKAERSRERRTTRNLRGSDRVVVGDVSVAIVITGQVLAVALDVGEIQALLTDVLLHCNTVLACRVSPLQKAELVGLVKTGMTPQPTTLAIGDGANDVGMIQRADVGIGIYGREGRQAANISDIAINEFQNLYRILQYHGRGNYRRIAIVIKYCFFKPMVITIVQLLFSFYNGFTGTQPIPALLGSLFDVLLVLPIAIVGWLDRDIEADAILRFPQLYHVSRTNSDLTVRSFVVMMAGMLWYGVCVFYVCWAYMDLMERFGLGDVYSFGCMVYFALIMSLNITVMMKQHTWTYVHVVAYIAVFGFFMTIYVLVGVNVDLSFQSYRTTSHLLQNTYFWLCQFTVAVGCLVWEAALRAILAFIPSREQLVLESELARVSLVDEVASDKASKQLEQVARASISGPPVDPVLLKSTRVRGGEVRSSAGVSFSVMDTLLAAFVTKAQSDGASKVEPEKADPGRLSPENLVVSPSSSTVTSPRSPRKLSRASTFEAYPLHFSLQEESRRKDLERKCRDVGADLMEATHCATQCTGTWTIPVWLLLGVFCCSTCMLFAKAFYWGGANTLYAETLYYDASLPIDEQPCIANEFGFCDISFVVEHNVFSSVQIFYKIEGFAQNRASYKNSFIQEQFQGTMLDPVSKTKDLVLCTANATWVNISTSGAQQGQQYFPCGMIATNMFQDKLDLTRAAVDAICNFTDTKATMLNSTSIETTGLSAAQLEQRLVVNASSGYFLRDFYTVLAPTDDNRRRFPCNAISDSDIFVEGLTDKYFNPPGYPDTLSPSFRYLHEQYPELVPRELGIQTPRVINWLQTAAMPVYKKLYGVLAHGVPAGNLTLRIHQGPQLTDSSLLRKSIVLIAGSAMTPSFDLFFYSYVGIIMGSTALLIVMAITIRICFPRKLASSRIEVKPIWTTRRGRGRGKRRQRAEERRRRSLGAAVASLRASMALQTDEIPSPGSPPSTLSAPRGKLPPLVESKRRTPKLRAILPQNSAPDGKHGSPTQKPHDPTPNARSTDARTRRPEASSGHKRSKHSDKKHRRKRGGKTSRQ